jgi:hypothetical protein
VRVVDRKARETPGTRTCHFCSWRLTVTEVDLCGDTIDAYDRHLTRHAQAATVADAETAIFRSLTDDLEP